MLDSCRYQPQMFGFHFSGGFSITSTFIYVNLAGLKQQRCAKVVLSCVLLG